MRNKTRRRLAGIAAVVMTTSLLLGVGPAAAGEQMVMDEVPITLTDWSDTLTVPQFDPADGILQSVEVKFDATVAGEAKYESLDAAPTTITIELKAEVELQRPDTSVLSLLAPLVTQVDSADAFDGAIDFDGPSGGTFTGLTATLNDTQVFTSPADLALFTGTGTLDFPVSATGRSTASGAGNLILNFRTDAGAKLTVTYTFVAPSIDIEKATNGEDADAAPGPTIPAGDPVTWTYVVTNTGDVDLENVTVTDDQGVAVSCPQTTLAVGESMTCTGNGTAVVGQYANIGSVVGTPVGGGEPVEDRDPSHYTGQEPPQPGIDIEKATNGEDADAAPGPTIPAGDPVTWTYVVTNTGDVDLENVTVTDDQGVAVSCPQTTLAVGESMTCTGNGTAVVGQYANIGSAVGNPVDDQGRPIGPPVEDSDPSHYTSPPPPGGEGCTPGYWKQPQHFGNWVGFSPSDSYSAVFGVPYDKTLLEALQTGGGREKALGRHSVAALLNAANGDVNFAFSTGQVIALVQDAWATGDYNGAKNQLAGENEEGCDLGRNPGPDGGSGQGKGKGKGKKP